MAKDFTKEDNFLKVTWDNNEPEYYSNPNGKFHFNEQRTRVHIIVSSAEDVQLEVALADITFDGEAPDDADDAIVKLKLLFPDTNSGTGGSGGEGDATGWKSITSVNMLSAGAAASAATTYAQINGKAGTFTTENGAQFIITEDCVADRLFVKTADAQPGSGSMVITLRVNGANTALTVTINASAAAGEFSDTTHSVALSAGDVICWQVVNNAGVGSATILSIGATLSGDAEISIAGVFDNNADALAALGDDKLYKSSTQINGSPIILSTVLVLSTYDNNADAVAALGVGKRYKSSTLINGSPIILITV